MATFLPKMAHSLKCKVLLSLFAKSGNIIMRSLFQWKKHGKQPREATREKPVDSSSTSVSLNTSVITCKQQTLV